MTALPWSKFYWPDWRSDPGLRLCSIGARGLWMEMLSVMHEANPRGSLVVNGWRVTSDQIANLAGVTKAKCRALLSELETAGVFSRDGDGTIYSRRMRRDEAQSREAQERGRAGGNPALNAGQGVKPEVNREVNRGVKPEVKPHEPRTMNQEPESSSLRSEGDGEPPPEPGAEFFRWAKPWLVDRGVCKSPNAAGGFLARLMRNHGDAAVMTALAKVRDGPEPADYASRIVSQIQSEAQADETEQTWSRANLDRAFERAAKRSREREAALDRDGSAPDAGAVLPAVPG